MKNLTLSTCTLLLFCQSLLAINVSGTISSDSTWTLANSPYILTGDVIVADETTLTIEAGVVIEFNSTLRDLIINGSLQAIGNSTDSIIFRGQTGVQGDVLIRNEGVLEVSTFEFCVFSSMGGNLASGSAVRLDVPTIFRNCRFNNNSDIIADADAIGSFDSNNRIEEIRVITSSLDSSATFANADSEGFYFELMGDIIVADSNVLTIDPGVEIRFVSSLHEFIINGKIIANGTATDSINFVGESPNYGGIRLVASGIVDTSVFAYCNFLYLGSLNVKSAIQVSQPFLLTNSTFNNTTDIISDGDYLSGIDQSNRLEKINIVINSLSTSTVWPQADDTGFKYVLEGDLVIEDSTTLTIEPGVTIEFTSSLHEFFVNGQMIADGTITDSIILKGNLNLNGAIILSNVGEVDTSIFRYCVFDRLGSLTSSQAALQVNNPVILTNCQFNSDRNILADADFVWGINNTNRLDVIDLVANTLDSTTVWPVADDTGFKYNSLGDQTIMDSKKLTINAGCEVNFNSTLHEFFVNGRLIAEGTSTDSIKFSANLSGSGGIYLTSTGDLDTSIIKYCSFKNIGSSTVLAALRVEHPALVANNSFSNARDVIASADFVWGFQENNRLKEIELLPNSLTTTCHWPVADDTGFVYRMQGDLIVPAGELLTIEEGVEVVQNSTLIELFINGQMIMMDNVPGKEVRFYRE